MTDTPDSEVTYGHQPADGPRLSPNGTGLHLLATLEGTASPTDETVEVHLYMAPGMSPARALLTAANMLTPQAAVELAMDADPVGLAVIAQELAETEEAGQ